MARTDFPDTRRLDGLGERLARVLSPVPVGSAAAGAASGHGAGAVAGAGWIGVVKLAVPSTSGTVVIPFPMENCTYPVGDGDPPVTVAV